MKELKNRGVAFAFRLAKTARDSMRELDHIRGVPGIEIFATAVWLMAGVIWTIAIKVGGVPSMKAGILGFAGIIVTGWVVMKALRARSRREAEEYYRHSSD